MPLIDVVVAVGAAAVDSVRMTRAVAVSAFVAGECAAVSA